MKASLRSCSNVKSSEWNIGYWTPSFEYGIMEVLGLVNFGFKMDPHLKKITDDRYGEDLIDEMEIKDVPIPPKREYDIKMDINGERRGGFSTKEE
ncbi:hypothetical protein RhiirC2_788946 [Rhizophagus irregularis]|uniref:Uncharacterized protein n=1 Tax=Rhizophagus irregularis TaxID=588596 RepID=A0A2N1MP56_9GLOM|nr:hypothetical protein RhiirC2_788946 [Rhizophagus irregularis]